MTMLSFRVDEETAARAVDWAEELGVDRSELLREALRAHLARLAAERDAAAWEAQPLSGDELALQEVSDWGPAEDWSDWDLDAAG
jgi:predicted transcriptional regulator